MLEELVKKVDSKIINEELFNEIDKIESFYSRKILDTFKKSLGFSSLHENSMFIVPILVSIEYSEGLTSYWLFL